MREIKFRAWDKLSKSMRYGVENSLIVCLNHPNDFVFTQFTGLRDKNNKKIYESDVVKVNILYGGVQIREVEYIDNGFKFSNQDEQGDYAHSDCEVIGNIYENPNLTKQEG